MSKLALKGKANQLAIVAHWPGIPRLDVDRWLSNFGQSERPVAEQIGLSLTFVSEQQFLHQLKDCLLSVRHLEPQYQRYSSGSDWRSLLRSATYCCFDDGKRHLADSGSMIARYLRDSIGIDSRRIKGFREVVREFHHTHPVTPLVFVDDILQSGDQFLYAWRTPVPINANTSISLEDLRPHCRGAWLFLPVFATAWGVDAVASNCEDLIIGHSQLLTKRDSWQSNEFARGDAALADAARDLIMKSHARAAFKIRPEYGHLGYKQQGLSIAFHHGTPDGTLPILVDESDSWRPLLKRGL